MTSDDLRQRRSLPLEDKVRMSVTRIREWAEYWDDNVYVSFSGGKDSTVLLHLVRGALGAEVPALFSDTGLEYPEIKAFVKSTPNVTVIRPKMSYREVVAKYGYAVISKRVARTIRDLRNPSDKNAATRTLYLTGIKRDGSKSRHFKLAQKHRRLVEAPFLISEQCCDVLKKEPFRRYERMTGRKPFIGSLAVESDSRGAAYAKSGCNAFRAKRPSSTPIAFWSEQDVLEYIVSRKLTIASVYGAIVRGADGKLRTTGEQRTGCMWCAFGAERAGPRWAEPISAAGRVAPQNLVLLRQRHGARPSPRFRRRRLAAGVAPVASDRRTGPAPGGGVTAAQPSLPGLAARPGWRRRWCRCGCGVWFYDSREGAGRPRLYANPDHFRNERNRRQNARNASRRLSRSDTVQPGAETVNATAEGCPEAFEVVGVD